MPDETASPGSDRSGLTLGARQLLSRADPGMPALDGWLEALMQRNGPLVEAMVPGVDAAAVLDAVRRQPGRTPLDEAALIQRAVEHAATRQRRLASEVDLAAVLLAAAGQAVPVAAEIGRLRRRPGPAAPTVGKGAIAATPSTTTPTMAASSASPGRVSWSPRASQPTPTLDRFGRDLTRQAADGELGVLVGREREVDLVVETLCRRHKRNPVLLGAAGTGKTAIVEGLARRVVCGEVPAALSGVRIVQLQPSSLVAGAGIVGELETRMRAILEEARQYGIVLFIDEVHAIVGTGGMRGTGDLASLLKPALARGDLACIAATTDDEYRRFIADDAALERRFNPVTVDELDEAATLAVLRAHRDELARLRSVSVPDALLEWLVHFAASAMPNRCFPDKAVDLLEQCVAHAVAHGQASLDRGDVEDVARQMVGVPLSVAERLVALERDLAAKALSNPAATSALIERLGVTMRGLDSRRERPNAVVLVSGHAAVRARELAETMATSLFGGPSRVVPIDLGRMTSTYDVAMLVGAPPGYIGYSDRLPIHRIASTPWCVVYCEGVDSAHPAVRELLAEAFEEGAFVDGSGRRIGLSDTIVILACGGTESGRPLGFRIDEQASEANAVDRHAPAVAASPVFAVRLVGERLAVLVDVAIDEHRAPADAAKPAKRALELLAERFDREGIGLEWDVSVGEWLIRRAGSSGDVQAAADRDLLPHLAPLVGAAGDGPSTFIVSVGRDGVRIVPRVAAPSRRAPARAGKGA